MSDHNDARKLVEKLNKVRMSTFQRRRCMDDEKVMKFRKRTSFLSTYTRWNYSVNQCSASDAIGTRLLWVITLLLPSNNQVKQDITKTSQIPFLPGTQPAKLGRWTTDSSIFYVRTSFAQPAMKEH